MFTFRTKGTDIAGRPVNQTVPDHLILPLETLSARRSRALGHWAIVRAVLGVNVGVGASGLVS